MLKDLINILYPKEEFCLFCSKGRTRGNLLCSTCLELFESYSQRSYCSKCGRFFPDRGHLKLCKECEEDEPPFQIARAIGPYEGLLKEVIHKFKYNRLQALAKPLAYLLIEVMLREESLKALIGKSSETLIIPVPLAKEKELERGFNQSLLLSTELGDKLGISLWEGELIKTVATPSQSKLVKIGRQANLKGAFTLRNNKNIAGKNILLVDDIFTTGTTVVECTKILKEGGVKEVFVLTTATGSRESYE